MPLTNTAIRKAKPTDKVQRLFDAGGLPLKGLMLKLEARRWEQQPEPSPTLTAAYKQEARAMRGLLVSIRSLPLCGRWLTAFT
jgi:hypothetical protein